MRALKRLEGVVSMSVVEPVMGDQGWEFGDGPGATPDTVNGKRRLGEIYLLADPRYSGRVSVPTLWDKERPTIVNNESPDIMRMFNSAFAGLAEETPDPPPHEMIGQPFGKRRMGYVQATTRRGCGLGGSPEGDRRGRSLAAGRHGPMVGPAESVGGVGALARGRS